MFIWIEDMFAITMCFRSGIAMQGNLVCVFFSIFSSDLKDMLTTGRMD